MANQRAVPAPEDFSLMTWVIDDKRRNEILNAAKHQGDDGEPDVLLPPIQTPPEISRIEDVVTQWCRGQAGKATAWFAPILKEIVASVDLLSDEIDQPHNAAEHEQRSVLRITLEGYRASMLSLEETLGHVLAQTVAHGNELISQYWKILLRHHPDPAFLDRQWDPPELYVPEECYEFGQHEARTALEQWYRIEGEQADDAPET